MGGTYEDYRINDHPFQYIVHPRSWFQGCILLCWTNPLEEAVWRVGRYLLELQELHSDDGRRSSDLDFGVKVRHIGSLFVVF